MIVPQISEVFVKGFHHKFGITLGRTEGFYKLRKAATEHSKMPLNNDRDTQSPVQI